MKRCGGLLPGMLAVVLMLAAGGCTFERSGDVEMEIFQYTADLEAIEVREREVKPLEEDCLRLEKEIQERREQLEQLGRQHPETKKMLDRYFAEQAGSR
jgi:hypothetical protein